MTCESEINYPDIKYRSEIQTAVARLDTGRYIVAATWRQRYRIAAGGRGLLSRLDRFPPPLTTVLGSRAYAVRTVLGRRCGILQPPAPETPPRPWIALDPHRRQP
jgi:hypothetical protein